MTERIFCQFCGTELRCIARYCKNCGGRVDDVVADEPAGQVVVTPLPRDDSPLHPWRQNENAIILPITRELPRAPAAEIEIEEESEVVPIAPSYAPTLPALVDSPMPLNLPRQAPRPGVETASYSPHEVTRSGDALAHRRKRVTFGIPLVLLAAMLLFVLAWLSLK